MIRLAPKPSKPAKSSAMITEVNLTIWLGEDQKDELTAEQWIERAQGVKDVLQMDDEAIMNCVHKSFRGRALAWYGLYRTEIANSDQWSIFKTNFTIAFSTGDSKGERLVNFAGLTQKDDESVIEFYNRVVNALDVLEQKIPDGSFPLPGPTYPRALTQTAEFSSLNAKNKRNAAHRLVRHGAKEAFNFLGMNIFMSGLLYHLQKSLLANPPKTLYAAFEKATETEKSSKRRNGFRPVSTLVSTQVAENKEGGEPIAGSSNRFNDNSDYDYDDDDGNGSIDNEDISTSTLLADVGLEEKELLTISTKDLNKRLKKRKIDQSRATDIKRRRRTLKNRGYASACRQKRDVTETTVNDEIGDLNVQIAVLMLNTDEIKNEVERYRALIKSKKFSNEALLELEAKSALIENPF